MKRAGAYPGKGYDEEVHDEPDDNAVGKTGYPWVAGEKGYVWIKEEENKRPGKSYAIMEQDPIYYHWGAAGQGFSSEEAAGDAAEKAGGLVIAGCRVLDDRGKGIEAASQ